MRPMKARSQLVVFALANFALLVAVAWLFAVEGPWILAAALALAAACCGPIAFAQDPVAPPQSNAAPQPGNVVRDPDFGVAARHRRFARK